jgi:catechol 2,3-dioxygenase-like lactoylglutathione lyase family enzyme
MRRDPEDKAVPMKLKKLWTGFITDKVRESREFYTTVLECGLVYEGENEWFVLLRLGESEIGFMKPDLDFQASVFRGAYAGQGAWITIDVDDVDAEHARIRALGVDIAVSLRDEPWGDRHFAILDPNGIGVDLVQRAEPPETGP